VFRKQAVAPSLEPRTAKAISSSGEFRQRDVEDTEKKNLPSHGETHVIPLRFSV